MARIENGEWNSIAVVFDGKSSSLHVSGEEEEVRDGRFTDIWIKPDGDGAEVVLRAPKEDGGG